MRKKEQYDFIDRQSKTLSFLTFDSKDRTLKCDHSLESC